MRRRSANRFVIEEEAEESYDATLEIPEDVLKRPPSSVVWPDQGELDEDRPFVGPRDATPRTPPYPPTSRARSNRTQFLGIAAIAACPILTALIGLVSLNRATSPLPQSSLHALPPERPTPTRGRPQIRGRGPALAGARIRRWQASHARPHESPRRANAARRAARDPKPRLARPASRPRQAPTTQTPSAPPPPTSRRHPGGEFVLGAN